MSPGKHLTLAYIFNAKAPQTRLPVGVEDWFCAFPKRPGDFEKVKAYIDNTYFFSRSCREYIFPEIVKIENDIFRSKPTIFNECDLPDDVSSTEKLSELIGDHWLACQDSRVIPDDQRLRRFLVSRIKDVPRGSHGWHLAGSLTGLWERLVTSVDIHLLDVEVQLYMANVGVVLLTVGIPEHKLDNEDYLKDLAAVTKDVLAPNTELPVANFCLSGGTSGVSSSHTWMDILDEVTTPFRGGDTPNARTLFTPTNQEFGQYLRRFWYLPKHDIKAAFNILRVNYLQPFKQGEPHVPIAKGLPAEAFNIDEGWDGLVHHHEFVISRNCSDEDVEPTAWWYSHVFTHVVADDYSWLWLLAIVQRVRLGRLLTDLDVSLPSEAEAELQAFYDFMQQENFAMPSTQPVGNQLAKKLSKLLDIDDLILLIEREAEVIRESVLQRSSRTQSTALAVIALLGTWLSLTQLAEPGGKWTVDWFKQPLTLLALPIIIAIYYFSWKYFIRRKKPRQR